MAKPRPMNDVLSTPISGTELDILIQSLEAFDEKNISIHQTWMLSALREVRCWRDTSDRKLTALSADAGKS